MLKQQTNFTGNTNLFTDSLLCLQQSARAGTFKDAWNIEKMDVDSCGYPGVTGRGAVLHLCQINDPQRRKKHLIKQIHHSKKKTNKQNNKMGGKSSNTCTGGV